MNEMESQNDAWTAMLGPSWDEVYSRTGTMPSGAQDGLVLGIVNAVKDAYVASRATFAGANGQTYTTPIRGVNTTAPQPAQNLSGLIVPALLVGLVYLLATD